ncbi:MAG: hypothetical protein A2045_03720 [Rhodocyclales bacterium GWA2_65_20]|nr:MAG: hypothetical protein A2045_03720 [Rhodocyclales bacterium GWA2_65_20]
MNGAQKLTSTANGMYSFGISRLPPTRCATTAARISAGNPTYVNTAIHIAAWPEKPSRASLVKAPGKDMSHTKAEQACKP